jgi:hypothetical protein
MNASITLMLCSVLALLATAANSTAGTLRVRFTTQWDDTCTVLMPNPLQGNQVQPIAPAFRPGPNRPLEVVIDPGLRTDNSVMVVIQNTAGKVEEFIGNWSINATCAVWLDDRPLVEKSVRGYEPRNATWNASSVAPFTIDQVAALAAFYGPQQIQGFVAYNQQRLTNLDPLVGNAGGALGQVTPLVPVRFQMPIGNNLGEQRRAQALTAAQFVAEAYRLAFGVVPSPQEVAYWDNLRRRFPKSTLVDSVPDLATTLRQFGRR